MPRKCLTDSDSFRFICREFSLKAQKEEPMHLKKKTLHLYFGLKVGNQAKTWAPHKCSTHCGRYLRSWLNAINAFVIPMDRKAQKDHSTDCYFCMTLISGFSIRSKYCIKYPNIPSVIRPASHDGILPVSKP